MSLLPRLLSAPVVTGRPQAPASWMLYLGLSWSVLNYSVHLNDAVLPLTLHRYFADPRLLALVLSINVAFNFLVGSACNYLSDHIWTRLGRRRPFILASWAGLVFALTGLAFASTLPWILFFLVLFQFFLDLSTPNGPLTFEVIPPAQRGRFTALRTMLQGGLHLYFFQVIFAHLDQPRALDLRLLGLGLHEISGTSAAFLFGAALALIFFFGHAFHVRESPPPDNPAGLPVRHRFSPRAFLREIFGRRPWLLLYLLYVMPAFIQAAQDPFNLLMLNAQFDFPKTEIARLLLPGQILTLLLGIPILGWLTDSIHRLPVRLFALALGLSLASLTGLFCFFPGPWHQLPSLPWLFAFQVLLELAALSGLALVFRLLAPAGFSGRRPHARLVLLAAAFGGYLLHFSLTFAGVLFFRPDPPPITLWFILAATGGLFNKAIWICLGPLIFDFVPRNALGTVSAGMGFSVGVAKTLMLNLAGHWIVLWTLWFSPDGSSDYTGGLLLAAFLCLLALGLTRFLHQEVRAGRLPPRGLLEQEEATPS